MADQDNTPLIVVKRYKKNAHEHHGGAWKIAYADFVTAMMAFFLLMWLISSMGKGDLQGIADYFKTPLKIALTGGESIGDRSSLIKGGGDNLSRSNGQMNKQDGDNHKMMSLETAQTLLQNQEMAKLRQLKEKLEKVINANPLLRQFRKQLLIDLTSEGLRIQIIDEKNRPMFDIGSAKLKPYTITILHEIGKALNGIDNKITLSGHTDAAPYPGGEKGYSNWELSSDRANASRRELIAGGMDESKVLRTDGCADAILFNKKDPLDPANRRISILIMTKKAEEMATNESNTVRIHTPDDLKMLNDSKKP